MGIESAANLRSYGFRKNTDEVSQHLSVNQEASSGAAEKATTKDRLSIAKKHVLGFAKALLKTAGDVVLDRIVGAGVAVGAISLQEAPLIKQQMKDVAEKTFRFLYIDGPKRIADAYTPSSRSSTKRDLGWHLMYRTCQAYSVINPLFVPAIAFAHRVTEKDEIFPDQKKQSQSTMRAV